MPTFIYICTGCGRRFEEPKHSMAGVRHLVDEMLDDVCGVLRRDYKAEAVGIDTSTLRAARS